MERITEKLKTRQNRSETPLNAIKTQVVHTARKGKSILLSFPLILNYSVRSLYSHTNSYSNAVTQCYVHGSQRSLGYLLPLLHDVRTGVIFCVFQASAKKLTSVSIPLFKLFAPRHTLTDQPITALIIYMKKLLDSDWLGAVQFKCNTSAKSVTPVQKV